MMMHCLLNMTYHSLSQSLLWFGQQRLAGSHWLQKAVCNRRPSHSSCRRFEGSHVVSFFPGTAPEHHPSALVYIRAERDSSKCYGWWAAGSPPTILASWCTSPSWCQFLGYPPPSLVPKKIMFVPCCAGSRPPPPPGSPVCLDGVCTNFFDRQMTASCQQRVEFLPSISFLHPLPRGLLPSGFPPQLLRFWSISPLGGFPVEGRPIPEFDSASRG